MKKFKLLIFALLALVSQGAWAQDYEDVTSTYLNNAGFDNSASWVTGNVAVNPADIRDVAEWTKSASSSWAGSASFAFGGGGSINGSTIPGTNSDGEASGGCVALTGAWDDSSGFAKYTQEITLPAGV